jgi:hypothetical protein
LRFKASHGNKSENIFQKYPTQKRAGKVAQVVEHLPNKPDALSSKKRKEGKKD